MNPLQMVTASAAPAVGASKWWPDLYLKKGRALIAITPEQCAIVREIYNAGRPVSQIPKNISLYDVTGAKIGWVSYNGRTWLNDIEDRVEIPQAGIPTAQEQAARNWGAKY